MMADYVSLTIWIKFTFIHLFIYSFVIIIIVSWWNAKERIKYRNKKFNNKEEENKVKYNSEEKSNLIIIISAEMIE